MGTAGFVGPSCKDPKMHRTMPDVPLIITVLDFFGVFQEKKMWLAADEFGGYMIEQL